MSGLLFDNCPEVKALWLNDFKNYSRKLCFFQVLKQDERILAIAKELHEQKSLLIMGRGYNFATCLEGALKVKELTYMHCEGIQVLPIVKHIFPNVPMFFRRNVKTMDQQLMTTDESGC